MRYRSENGVTPPMCQRLRNPGVQRHSVSARSYLRRWGDRQPYREPALGAHWPCHFGGNRRCSRRQAAAFGVPRNLDSYMVPRGPLLLVPREFWYFLDEDEDDDRRNFAMFSTGRPKSARLTQDGRDGRRHGSAPAQHAKPGQTSQQQRATLKSHR